MSVLLVGAAAALGLGSAVPVGAQAAPFCAPGEAPRFVLGFAALRDQVGEAMGTPLECEHADPASGDSLARTTTGLAFYRQATNTPTFTDGFNHWALRDGALLTWAGASIDPPAEAAAPPPPGPGATYLALGDSLAAGVGASNPGRVGATALVAARLQSAGAVSRMVNLGVERETTASFAAPGGQLGRALDVLRDPTIDVRVVTLSLGSNDLLHLLDMPPCSTSPTGAACRAAGRAALVDFASAFPDLLRALSSAAGGRPKLVVTTAYNPFSGTGSAYEALVDEAVLGTGGQIDCSVTDPRDPRVGLADLQTCLAAAAGAEVVDAYAVFRGRALLLTGILAGDIHPNDAGHRLLAAAILAKLT